MRGRKRKSTLQQRQPRQTETLETPLLDLGPDVTLVTLSREKRLVYCSAVMRHLLNEIAIFAPLQCDILIIGETGTGKELIAQAIHERSGRQGPFMVLNCATIPEHLAESLLFGHVKGAFTGAACDRKGIFEEATGGTAFLDEFAELPPADQAKILRVLQERKITRVGRWGVEVPVDVRIIAATNRDMGSMVVDRAFRLDLIHRFHKDLRIPPLRERREDILPLANYFINELYRKGVIQRRPTLSPPAERALTAYDFPGNVRELDRIILLAAAESCAEATPSIEGRKIEKIIAASRWRRFQPDCIQPAQEEIRLKTEDRSTSTAEIETPDYGRVREVLKMIQRCGGNQAEAAKSLGITRQAVSYYVKKFLVSLEL